MFVTILVCVIFLISLSDDLFQGSRARVDTPTTASTPTLLNRQPRGGTVIPIIVVAVIVVATVGQKLGIHVQHAIIGCGIAPTTRQFFLLLMESKHRSDMIASHDRIDRGAQRLTTRAIALVEGSVAFGAPTVDATGVGIAVTTKVICLKADGFGHFRGSIGMGRRLWHCETRCVARKALFEVVCMV